MSILRQAHDVGERVITQANARLLERSSGRIRQAIGLDQDPPPPCNDPETSYMPLGGAAREFHAEKGLIAAGGWHSARQSARVNQHSAAQ